MTHDQYAEIVRTCKEQGIPLIQRARELNINPKRLYDASYKMRLLQAEKILRQGSFIQVSPPSGTQGCVQAPGHEVPGPGPVLLEIQSVQGTQLRLSGSLDRDTIVDIIRGVCHV